LLIGPIRRRCTRFSLDYLCEKWGITPRVPWLDPDVGAALTNYLIARWLDAKTESEAPLFLFVNYMEAHLPYRVPKPYRRSYMTEAQVDRSYDLCHRVYGPIVPALNLRFNLEGSDFFAAEDREVLKRQYEAAVRYLDDRVGELITIFERRGLLDNTLVVIASDHGEYLDTHGMWSHRMQLYDDVTHVCLMLRRPAEKGGTRASTPVLLSDLYGTVLNVTLGRSSGQPAFGTHDLLALTAMGNDRSRVVVTEYGGARDILERIRELDDAEVNHRAQPQVAAQDGRYKYIASADGQRELYDLVSDPTELHNVIDARPAEAERLARHLDQWREAVPVYQPSHPDARPMMDPEVADALRGLGYLGGE
jgi:arylsulfatase A-like enzyme